MAIAIQVENISKQYRLGKVGTGTIAHDINRWWHLLRGKEDPYLKIGEINDRSTKGESEYIWALQNINFEIEQGEAVGIIGRNGAGKSTLLKILSRTTGPTTGSIKLKGRVASLLEVGTGFHPELTGRENIYLNGAILGMRKKEITRKLDEIIDFSGVERYIDTPVKRYSSGMYVRLAFAVAAHLESEILIVDEVLAVGDAEFQKKCLGKMGEVSKGEGRTVLFVSHNMHSILNLCDSGILLENGFISFVGHTQEVIKKYLVQSAVKNKVTNDDVQVREGIYCESARFIKVNDEEIIFELNVQPSQDYADCRIGLYFKDQYENVIASHITPDNKDDYFPLEMNKLNKILLTLKNVDLIDGEYLFSFWLKSKSSGALIRTKARAALSFEKFSNRIGPKDGGSFSLKGKVIVS